MCLGERFPIAGAQRGFITNRLCQTPLTASGNLMGDGGEHRAEQLCARRRVDCGGCGAITAIKDLAPSQAAQDATARVSRQQSSSLGGGQGGRGAQGDMGTPAALAGGVPEICQRRPNLLRGVRGDGEGGAQGQPGLGGDRGGGKSWRGQKGWQELEAGGDRGDGRSWRGRGQSGWQEVEPGDPKSSQGLEGTEGVAVLEERTRQPRPSVGRVKAPAEATVTLCQSGSLPAAPGTERRRGTRLCTALSHQ